MDFTLTEEQQALQSAARDFARGEMTAVAEETERAAAPLPRGWVKRYAEMGFLGVNIPSEHGGLGLGNVEAFLVLEEFAKVSSAVAFPILSSSRWPAPSAPLEHFADDALKRRVIPAVCRGEAIVAVAMSEPDAGTALTDLRTRADVCGDRGRRQRRQALVLRRRALGRLPRLLPPVGCPRGQGHRGRLRREGDAGADVRRAGAADGVPGHSRVGPLLRRRVGAAWTSSWCRPAGSRS